MGIFHSHFYQKQVPCPPYLKICSNLSLFFIFDSLELKCKNPKMWTILFSFHLGSRKKRKKKDKHLNHWWKRVGQVVYFNRVGLGCIIIGCGRRLRRSLNPRIRWICGRKVTKPKPWFARLLPPTCTAVIFLSPECPDGMLIKSVILGEK